MKKIVAISVLIFVLSGHAWVLDIHLFKKVTLPFNFGDWKYAEKSGDLIVRSAEKDRIIVYNNKGEVVYQWGPELERQSLYVDISYDGRTYIFDSGQGIYENIKIHYCCDGQEIWRKDLAGHGRGIGKPFLSPDGSYILAISDMETGEAGIKCFDSQGKLLWHKHKDIDWLYYSETSDFYFSSDSKYFWATSRADGNFYLFNSNGDLLMQKKYSNGSVKGGKYVPISWQVLLDYIPRPPDDEMPRPGVYDLDGNYIMPNLGTLSEDGTKWIDSSSGKIKIMEFPSLTVLYESYPYLERSYHSEGYRYIFGEKDNEFYLIDAESKALLRRTLEGEISEISYYGRYFLLSNLSENKIWFYEVID